MSTGVSHRCKHHLLLCGGRKDAEMVVLCKWERSFTHHRWSPNRVQSASTQRELTFNVGSDQAATRIKDRLIHKLPLPFLRHKEGCSEHQPP